MKHVNFLHRKSYIVHINDLGPLGFMNLEGPGSSRALDPIELCILFDPESNRVLGSLGSWVLEGSASLRTWVFKRPLESWALGLWYADINWEHIFRAPLFYWFSHPTKMHSLSVGNHRARKQYKSYTFMTELDSNGYLLVCFRDFTSTLWITKVS